MEATWGALLANLEEWMGKRPNTAASSHQKNCDGQKHPFQSSLMLGF